MKTFYCITHVGGIPVRIHYTWIIAVLIGGWIVSARVLAEAFPDISGLYHLLLVASILIGAAASVVLHELGHFAVARMFRLRPRLVTLYPFGGIPSQLDQRAGPGASLWIALAGPVASLLVWGGLYALSMADGLGAHVQLVIASIAQVNLGLALLNFLPGLPLDGGRIVRAIAWQLTLVYSSATAVARRAGQVIAYGLIFFGGWLLVSQEGDLVALIYLLAGWMLREAGSVNQQRGMVDQMLQKLHAADIARAATKTISPDMTLREVYHEIFRGQMATMSLPVVSHGRFVGMLSTRAMLDVPQGLWDKRAVADVMALAATLPLIRSDEPLSSVIPRINALQADEAQVLPVLSEGKLIGVVDSRRLDALLDVEEALALYGVQSAAEQQGTPVKRSAVQRGSGIA